MQRSIAAVHIFIITLPHFHANSILLVSPDPQTFNSSKLQTRQSRPLYQRIVQASSPFGPQQIQQGYPPTYRSSIFRSQHGFPTTHKLSSCGPSSALGEQWNRGYDRLRQHWVSLKSTTYLIYRLTISRFADHHTPPLDIFKYHFPRFLQLWRVN